MDDYAVLRGDKRIARIQGFEEVVAVGGGFEALKSIATNAFELLKPQRKKEPCQTNILSLNATDARSRLSVQTTLHEPWQP